MGKDKWSDWSLSRREALKVCLAPAGLAAANWLVGCSDEPKQSKGTDSSADADEREEDETSDDVEASDGANAEEEDDAEGQGAADAGRDGGADASAQPSKDASSDGRAQTGGDAATDAAQNTGDASDSADAATGSTEWASGGTKSMQGGYPDPFAMGAVGTACALYPAQTLGPCYSGTPAEREDISEGVTGVPVRLSFLVVRSDGCTPVPSAEVDIWHSGSNGIYSAYASGICNPDRLDVADEQYCRGRLKTDENGRVDFSTVFPGWYTGRSIHIHFTVRAEGREYITSQLYFEDALSDEILEQPDYAARGPRDTTNQNDSILRGANIAPFVFSTAKRADGALHAWKVLSVRG